MQGRVTVSRLGLAGGHPMRDRCHRAVLGPLSDLRKADQRFVLTTYGGQAPRCSHSTAPRPATSPLAKHAVSR
jgi:hypothetical protein